MSGAIFSFTGEYRFLSNFSGHPIYIAYLRYPTVEHAFQAHKALTVEDHNLVRNAATPGQAKKLGRKIIIRPNWDDERVEIMRKFVQQKFIQNKGIGRKLEETGNVELIEGNKWGDTFWGVCNGVGENHLGKILMEIRDILQGVSCD